MREHQQNCCFLYERRAFCCCARCRLRENAWQPGQSTCIFVRVLNNSTSIMESTSNTRAFQERVSVLTAAVRALFRLPWVLRSWSSGMQSSKSSCRTCQRLLCGSGRHSTTSANIRHASFSRSEWQQASFRECANCMPGDPSSQILQVSARRMQVYQSQHGLAAWPGSGMRWPSCTHSEYPYCRTGTRISRSGRTRRSPQSM